ncbi:MAG: hypothetical protein DMD91_21100 [Candidatus Rokuibacteriota bacterium]|nr:MAG: hypothetical protein DMD91_21100 [Candidatus Rokubacteria bacterium]
MLIVVPVAVATLLCWLAGRWLLKLPRPGWGPLVLMLEYLGASAAFLLLDLLIGAGLVFIARATIRGFVSLYVLGGMLVIPLALCQGLLFWSWWRAARRCR